MCCFLQVVRNIDPESLVRLLGQLRVGIEGKIGNSYDKLFLNFATPAMAQQAAIQLHNLPSPSINAPPVAATIKDPVAFAVSANASTLTAPTAAHSGTKFRSVLQNAFLPGHSTAADVAGVPAPATQRMFSADLTVVLELGGCMSAGVVQELVAAWQQRGEFAACGAVQAAVHQQHIYINFATAMQAAAAADKFNEGITIRFLYKQITTRAVVKSSLNKSQLNSNAYPAPRLSPADEAYYSSAGLLCLRRSYNGNMEVLLGRQHGQLTLLGGKRNLGESSCLTAMREFSEETSYQLDQLLIAQLIPHASVVWIGGAESNAKYALYILDLGSISTGSSSSAALQQAVHQQFTGICNRFAKFRNSSAWRQLPIDQQEMQAIEWVRLDARHVLAARPCSCSPFLSKVMAECRPLQQWAAHTVQQHAGPAGQGLPAFPFDMAMQQPADARHSGSTLSAMQSAAHGLLPAWQQGSIEVLQQNLSHRGSPHGSSRGVFSSLSAAKGKEQLAQVGTKTDDQVCCHVIHWDCARLPVCPAIQFCIAFRNDVMPNTAVTARLTEQNIMSIQSSLAARACDQAHAVAMLSCALTRCFCCNQEGGRLAARDLFLEPRRLDHMSADERSRLQSWSAEQPLPVTPVHPSHQHSFTQGSRQHSTVSIGPRAAPSFVPGSDSGFSQVHLLPGGCLSVSLK